MAEYKRRVYLINPTFQLKFSFLICLLLFLSSLIYPLAIYDLINQIVTSIAPKFPDAALRLSEKRNLLIGILALWQLGFTALVFIICIFFSHKIAGPLFKLTKFLQNMRNGNQAERLFFRNGDYFHEVADEFNKTFETIQENYRKDFVYLSEVHTYLNNLAMTVPDDKKVVLGEINKRLSEIQSRFGRQE